MGLFRNGDILRGKKILKRQHDYAPKVQNFFGGLHSGTQDTLKNERKNSAAILKNRGESSDDFFSLRNPELIQKSRTHPEIFSD